MVHLLSPMTVWARFGSQVPAKVVAWNHVGGSGLTVAPAINDVKQLGGKTVAIPFWYSIHNVVLQYLLRENGLEPVSRKDGAPAANEVNGGDGAGRHAAGAGAEPHRRLHRGRTLQCRGRDAGRGQGAALYRRRLAQPRLLRGVHARARPAAAPRVVAKVVDAIVQAQLWIRDNREETARLLSKEGINRYTPHGLPALSKGTGAAAVRPRAIPGQRRDPPRRLG